MENEKILATVGGVNITDAEVDAFIESLPNEQKAYAAIPQFRQQCVEQLVAVQLYALMAEEEKLDETGSSLRSLPAQEKRSLQIWL